MHSTLIEYVRKVNLIRLVELLQVRTLVYLAMVRRTYRIDDVWKTSMYNFDYVVQHWASLDNPM